MRTPIGTFVTACALAAALLAAGCGGDDGKDTAASGELFLQPVAAQGPDPFTDSTATSTATPPPVTRTPQPTGTPDAVRSYSGSTPGLYGGTERVGSCDVNRQIGYLTADRAKARAFAGAAGISQASIPTYLRGLAPVLLRADTRVTNHGYRDGRATTYQSVLQAGTAVLVDNRGVPRVRCACGNPLKPPVAMQGSHGTSGAAWSGYRPAQVIVVTPAPQVITNITIINVVNNTWIERRIGHEVHHDRPVPPPDPVTPTPAPTTPTPSPDDSASSASPSESSASPSDERTGPTDCVTPTVTVTPGTTPSEVPSPDPTDCPTATATPPSTVPDSPLVPTDESGADTTVPDFGGTVPEDPSSDELGPESVPDTPDVRDGGGLIPDDPDDPAALGSIFGSPTDVFGS
ncbi:DUF6777 domain-containing protein [Streptomyces sp. NPDC050803]|uniref:DUF6777 domain-containing protein n=1 Tax=unclassified Streptomyces TaxID=2593676 RepID=UPI0034271047